MRLIAAGGSRAVTLAAVGAEAGYSRGIVSHHFGSRAALMDAVAREGQRRFSPPTAGGSGRDRVLGLVDAYLAAFTERELDARVFLVLWAEAIAGDQELRPVFAQRDEAFRRGWAAVVRAGLADGSIRAGVDPDAVAVLLAGLLRGVGLQRLLTPDAVDLDAVRAEAAAILGRALT